jgi:hypothetical protein
MTSQTMGTHCPLHEHAQPFILLAISAASFASSPYIKDMVSPQKILAPKTFC